IAKETLIWTTPFQTVLSGGFEHGDIAWFLEGQLSATYNCVDKHAIKKPDK
ncbi:37758_t:CDS:1, partial [Gigaspora margarita]